MEESYTFVEEENTPGDVDESNDDGQDESEEETNSSFEMETSTPRVKMLSIEREFQKSKTENLSDSGFFAE